MYRGRFAPSPTGPLHFGSLVAAVAGYVDARRAGGVWLVRMEDLDVPRCVPGAAEQILRDLEQFGFTWDEPVEWQSHRIALYENALRELKARDLVYPCGCSRKDLADALKYPGTCSRGLAPGRREGSWRLRVAGKIAFTDRKQGKQEQDLPEEVGDFVVLRADGIFAYQLAVVVDDHAQGITDVVRGEDLLDSTARQIYLQRLLGAPEPRYLHIPVAKDAQGFKLSKQTGALPIDAARAAQQLCDAFAFLGEAPPKEFGRASVRDVWAWALR